MVRAPGFLDNTVLYKVVASFVFGFCFNGLQVD